MLFAEKTIVGRMMVSYAEIDRITHSLAVHLPFGGHDVCMADELAMFRVLVKTRELDSSTDSL